MALDSHKNQDSGCSCRHDTAGRTKWRQLVCWLFPITGLVSLIWFLVRVVPKPSRAAYPCQRVAMPIASSFILWIMGLLGSLFAYRRAKALFLAMRPVLAIVCLLAACGAGLVALLNTPIVPAIADGPANSPIGQGKGIFPGRVVWVHDPNATDWGGTDNNGNDIGYGYWWESTHTDQAVVDNMMTKALLTMTEETSEAAAWNAIFRHFNQNKGRGDVSYQPGQKITIKANMVTSMGNSDASGNQTSHLGWVNTSPQMIMAILRQLVYVVGMEQSDITLGDTTTYFPNHYWDYCTAEFPDVNYLAASSNWGRRGAVSSEGTAVETPMYWSTPGASGTTQDYLPVSYAEADYFINFACFKGHSSGVTLCGKNHYGSFIRLPNTAGYYDLHLSLPNPGWSPGMGYYRAHVDIMGHPKLGGNTVLYLIDGLYGGYYWEGRPYKWNMSPFNGDWPSSLFMSQDPVAIDSVAHDFLLEEWPRVTTGGTGVAGSLLGGQEDYLHEAAEADAPASGTSYDPDNDGTAISESLGVHEHWNNAIDKQYSRDLGSGFGIELVSPEDILELVADIDQDGDVDMGDFSRLAGEWLECTLVDVGGCHDLIGGGAPPLTQMGIATGVPTVDGVLSPGEWDAAYWIDMNQIYNGTPIDLSNAQWAAMWGNNMIYVAVTGVDTDHVLLPSYNGWNAMDAIEVYVDADNGNEAGWSSTFDVAQQYVLSPQGDGGGNWTGGEWMVLGGGTTVPPAMPVERGVSVDGDEYVYELGVQPYAYFDLNNVGNSTLVTLNSGAFIGLDVVMNTKHASGFGMWCQNTDGGKYNDAGQFLDLELFETGYPCGAWGYFAGDLNQDCVVDLQDLSQLCEQWLAVDGTTGSLVAPGAVLVEEYVASNFFEGPMWDPASGKLYFVAWTTRQVLRLDGGGSATIWLTDAAKGVNGTFLALDGRMLTAEVSAHKVMSYQIGATGPEDEQQLAYDPTWMQPNDLCQTAAGDIYFTDPQWGGDHSASAVYRRAPDGTVTQVIDDMTTPNGIIASNDGLTLYVADSLDKLWRRYAIRTDGSLGQGTVFFDPESSHTAVPDGMSIDEQGNVYATGLGGVWIISPTGEMLEMISVPEAATNVTFGGADGKTLYITCDGKVYSLAMLVSGW